MKAFILIGFFMLLLIPGYSQVVTIRDQETKRPIELVTLSSEDPPASAITGKNGQVDINQFREAAKIEIRIVGYKTVTPSYDQLKQAGYLVYMIPSVVSLDQVVVSASRWSQSRREIPARINSILPNDVAFENPRTAADLLGLSGEVMIQKSQQGGGSPMIRGFSANRLLITVDGIRMNTAIFRSGNVHNVISLDPFVMDRTEVLFGPGSVIYGSDAIGGVMNFYTLPADLSPNGNLNISGNAGLRFSSANNEITGHIHFNTAWQKWASVTSFSQFNCNDLKMGKYGPDEYLRHVYVQHAGGTDLVLNNDDPLVQRPTGYSQTNVMQKIFFRPNERWDLSYGFHYSTTSNIDRYDRLIRFKNSQPVSAEWYYGPQVWMMNNLKITDHGPSVMYDEMTITLAYQLFKESRIDRDFNDPIRRIREERVNAYSFNLDFKKSVAEKHLLFYGAEVVYNDVASTGTDEDIITDEKEKGPPRYPESNWSSLAAYLTWHYHISDQFTFQAGARYNQFILNARFDTIFYPFPFTTANLNNGALTGSMGWVYRPGGRWALSANFSTGFRSPNVDDMGKVFDSEPGSVVVPNPDLDAEYAWNAELGIAKIFGDWLKIDMAAYYTFLNDAMVRRDFSLNGMDSIIYDGEMSKVQAVQNAAQATVYGIQAGMELKLPFGFGMVTDFNYQKGEEEMDDGSVSPLRHAGPMFGMMHLTWTARKMKWDVYGIYNGEIRNEDLPPEEQSKAYMYASDINGNPYCPDWYTLNLKGMYQLTGQISINGGIENITNQRYRPYSSGIAAAGRNFLIALKVNF